MEGTAYLLIVAESVPWLGALGWPSGLNAEE